jgi:hypothetical protein
MRNVTGAPKGAAPPAFALTLPSLRAGPLPLPRGWRRAGEGTLAGVNGQVAIDVWSHGRESKQ